MRKRRVKPNSKFGWVPVPKRGLAPPAAGPPVAKKYRLCPAIAEHYIINPGCPDHLLEFIPLERVEAEDIQFLLEGKILIPKPPPEVTSPGPKNTSGPGEALDKGKPPKLRGNRPHPPISSRDCGWSCDQNSVASAFMRPTIASEGRKKSVKLGSSGACKALNRLRKCDRTSGERRQITKKLVKDIFCRLGTGEENYHTFVKEWIKNQMFEFSHSFPFGLERYASYLGHGIFQVVRPVPTYLLKELLKSSLFKRCSITYSEMSYVARFSRGTKIPVYRRGGRGSFSLCPI
jgi:hypothetical protein